MIYIVDAVALAAPLTVAEVTNGVPKTAVNATPGCRGTPSFNKVGYDVVVVGKLLVNECIKKARTGKLGQIIIHSTMAMQTAWKMYEQLGFVRSADLDFLQGQLPVYGFRLLL